MHYEQDTQSRDLTLCYFRDRDGREVDFVVADKGRPLMAVECKWADTSVDRSLRYFKARHPECEAWQVTGAADRDFTTPEGIRVCPALQLLRRLT